MSEQKRQAVSALMDAKAEHPDSELSSVLADADARATWGRYHLIRDALQNELPDALPLDFADRVSAAIADEPALLSPQVPLGNMNPAGLNPAALPAKAPAAAKAKVAQAWWQPVVGFAAAASVFVAVMSLWQQGAVNPAPLATDMAHAQTAPAVAVPAAPAADEAEHTRLEEMLLNHTESVSSQGLNMMLPYARVVSDRLVVPAEQAAAALETDDAGKNAKADNAVPVQTDHKPEPNQQNSRTKGSKESH